MQSKPPVDLTSLQVDATGKSRYAVFLPAISSFYSNYVSKQQHKQHVPADRIPDGFDRGIEGMNFLNPEQGYFTYKYSLYSAGHAQLDVAKSIVDESMIQQRDRSKTTIIGDSGGYQIGKGVLKFDWLNFDGPAANKTRDDIIAWLELTADWAVMLDVPIWACDITNRARTGLINPADCLEKTRFNNAYLLKNRLGKTKWLNVLQGSNWLSAQNWYEGVKEFSDPAVWGDKAAEGWAFGGINMSKMDVTLKRLMIMREEGMLTNKNWIHFLGTGQLDWACYLTSIQRQIRKHINEEITISFDCASPFLSIANGQAYTNAQHTTKRWGVITDNAPDNKDLAESTIPFPFESEFGRRLTMGDICQYRNGTPDWTAINEHNSTTENEKDKITTANVFKDPKILNNQKFWIVMGDKNKINKVGATSWDSFSYALMMGHNVYCHIVAVQRANQLLEIERASGLPDWRHWAAMSPTDTNSDQHSAWVPRDILYFDRFVEELFNTKTLDEAMDMLSNTTAKAFLNNISGARLRMTSNGQKDNAFLDLFDVADDADVLDESQSDKLWALEEELTKQL